MSVARHAYTLSQFRRERLSPGATTLDAFADYRDWYATAEDEAHAYLMSFDEADVLRFLRKR